MICFNSINTKPVKFKNMKTSKRFLQYLVLLMVAVAIFSGCKKEDDGNKYEILVDHLKEQGLDLPVVHANVDGQGWAVPAGTLNANLADYYIIDLRSANDFNAGRITGAVNSTLENVLTEAARAGNKKIALVCYSGQVAAYAVAACRLSGYPRTFFLKWGMSAWNPSKDVWTSKIGNAAISPDKHANWASFSESPASFAANVDHGKTPVIKSASDDGAQILKERVAAVLKEGAKFVQPADVLANPSNYFVNNYWTVANVTDNGNGHVNGAFRINPLTLAANEVKFLSPDQKVVTYCWTGQTSAAVTFYLRVLGFDAYGMQWGANALNNSQLKSNKWPEGQQNLTLVTQ
jgi:rhodanese-related sulfurtransferase